MLLPEGALEEGAEALETDAALMLGEDTDGGWSRAFGVSAPATVIVSPKGEAAWKEEGELTATKLSRALAKVAEPGGKVSWRPLRLGVASDDKPPEFPFRVSGGGELSLRRMRGRDTVLAFWTSWCEPSLEQLRELASAHEESEGRGPIVLAVGDGESARSAARVAKEEGLPFPVIPDPDRAISRRYGVGCWPTTVWIGRKMRVEAVNFGFSPMNGNGVGGGHGYEEEPGKGPYQR